MKASKKYLVIAMVALVVLVAGSWCISHQWTESARSSDTGRYMDIESYVKSSISELSPIKSSLGGTFFVTDIETQEGAGTVSYEDGHNAYTADFTYTIDEDGKPAVTTFTVAQ